MANITQSPSIGPAVEIYPVHLLDDTKTLRSIVVWWTLRFDDVLDADMLHAALSNLLNIGDWKKIGGRLKMKQNGKLELHVPQPFTDSQPAVFYTHQKIHANIDEHDLAKLLPKATDGPSIQRGPSEFRAFAAREGAPETLEDFIQHEAPQLSLHITSFHDATLIGLSWPHTLMDVMGQQALLHAWSLVLAGKESEVPPVLGAYDDALMAALDIEDSERQTEKFGLMAKRLSGFSMFSFGLRFLWDMFWYPTITTRTIFLPKTTLVKLRKQAQDDLKALSDEDTAPYISDGDVLTAWATRLIALSQPRPRPITILHPVNARFRLQNLRSSSGVYIQNMALAACTFLTSTTSSGAMGPIALENRNCLAEQTTECQIIAFLRELRDNPNLGGDPSIVCGDSNALLVPFTNWTRAEFFKSVDFSPALMKEGQHDQASTPGKLVYHHAGSMRTNSTIRNVVVITGQDHAENYWLTASLPPSVWSRFEEEIGMM